MAHAIEEARRALATGDVPVGAVVVAADGSIVGRGRNQREELRDPTAHAEVIALREAASARRSWRLDDCTLVVTLEPCIMCAGAVLAARIPRIVLGTWDPKAGATGSQWDVVRDGRIGSKVEVVSAVMEAECAALLTQFFTDRRE